MRSPLHQRVWFQISIAQIYHTRQRLKDSLSSIFNLCGMKRNRLKWQASWSFCRNSMMLATWDGSASCRRDWKWSWDCPWGVDAYGKFELLRFETTPVDAMASAWGLSKKRCRGVDAVSPRKSMPREMWSQIAAIARRSNTSILQIDTLRRRSGGILVGVSFSLRLSINSIHSRIKLQLNWNCESRNANVIRMCHMMPQYIVEIITAKVA